MLSAFILYAALSITPPADEAASAPVVGIPALEFSGYTDAGDLRLAIDAATIAGIAHEATARLRLAISPVESLILDLQQFEVVAPGARCMIAGRDGGVAAALPNIICLRGAIAGESLSHVFIALSRDDSSHGLGLVRRRDGEWLLIGTDRSGARPTLTLRRGPGDVPDFEHFCSVIPLDAGDEGGIAGLPANAAAGPRVLNVAVDADQAFCQMFSDEQAALNYIAMVLGAVSDIYIRDLHMKIALRFARLWPNGGEPFQATDVSGFRAYWQANEDMDGLNLVHMFSGRRDTSYGGIAYLTNACTQSAFGISAFLLGGFPSPVVAAHLENWDVNVVAHEMGHNLGALHTHDLNPPVDTCAQGSVERGTIMSYCHTVPGGLLNIDMIMHARTQDEIAADNPNVAASCLWHDCNDNLINDIEDIVFGFSVDSNGDDTPDECQDCNSNGTLDPVEIAGGAPDVNANGVLDSCEADCNGNGQPDRWECAQSPAIDVNGNRVPDSCEPDCNGNGIADFIDIADATSIDLDRNSRPDECDDCNANGLADWIDMDRAFNVYISLSADLSPHPVREYHAASGVLVTNYPGSTIQDSTDLAFGPDGQLYVVSVFDFRIVRLNVDTGAESTFITPASAGFTQISSIVFGPDGTPYTVSPVNGNVRRYTSSGEFVSVFADVDGTPWDMAFGPNGNLFILTGTQGVYEVNGTTGALVGTFAAPTNLNLPRGMCFLPNGDLLVTNRGNGTVRRFSSTGTDMGVWNDEYSIQQPWGITLGLRGHVYLASESNPVRIVEYTLDGRYIRSFVRGDPFLISPRSIVFRAASPDDADGDMVLDICQDDCAADITPSPAGDGVVNVDDLLDIIAHWGACQGVPCPGDVAPPPDGVVDVNDLLLVISSWGPCS